MLVAACMRRLPKSIARKGPQLNAPSRHASAVPKSTGTAAAVRLKGRAKFPDIRVIVHPECKWEVVQKADLAGSTAYIVDQVRKAPPGSEWAIGTEVHLVN